MGGVYFVYFERQQAELIENKYIIGVVMTLQELFILNNILDGRDVYFLPKFSTMAMTGPLYDTAKDMLVKRNLLNNFDEFTDEGVLVVKLLRDFKAARKYISILNLSIGLIDDIKAVMISQNDINDYDIKMINVKQSVKKIFEVFDFPTKAKESKTSDGVKTTINDLKRMNVAKQNSFRLKTKDDKTKTDELYFLSENQLYIFDFRTHTLYPKSSTHVVNLLIERLTL